MGLPTRLLNLFRRGRLSRDLDEELRFHLEERVDDLTTAGMSEADARREARRQFGNLAAYKERTRERDLLAGVEFVGQDLRHALRALQHAPAFTVTALVTLALAIGANTAVFSVVNGVLLNALPVLHPEDLRIMRWSGLGPRIGMFSGTSDHGLSGAAGLRDGGDAFSYPLYQGLRRAAAADADVFGYYQLRGVTTRGRHEAVVDDGLIVTESFFEGLAISPLLGRPLTASDDIDGAPPAVVISHALWTTQFDQDPAVIGQHVSLDRRPFDVVGVLPADFHGPGFDTPVAFYVPMSARGQLAPNWTSVSSSDTWWLHLMARLRRDGNEQRLQSAVTNTFAALTADVMQAPRVEIADGRAGLATDRQRYAQPLAILMSVVVIVLMIAATNLAGLSIARGAARQHEWSIRAALGGGRWRIIRQSLAESAILAVAGGALGLLVAVWRRTGRSLDAGERRRAGPRRRHRRHYRAGQTRRDGRSGHDAPVGLTRSATFATRSGLCCLRRLTTARRGPAFGFDRARADGAENRRACPDGRSRRPRFASCRCAP
jgi:hypothetical protein